MIAVSNDWKKVNKEYLLPETFVEISVGIADVGIQDYLTTTGENEAVFSNTVAVIGNVNTFLTKYATLEHNLWVLDGSNKILPNTGPYNTPGYANDGGLGASVTLSSSVVRSTPIPGFTITWSSEYDEYATDFTIEVKNGNTVVASKRVTNNTSVVSSVEMDVVDYDTVTVTVHGWSLPDRRVRLEGVTFGFSVTFNKNDILAYSHEQSGCLNSGELPKNSINFTLDNSDGKWNPYNPAGIGKYLMERQLVSVRYGMIVNGVVEWIKAGRFYLSEWKAPSNGLEATFSARDAFEFLLNSKADSNSTGTLAELVNLAASKDLPVDVYVVVDSRLKNYSASHTNDLTRAEVIQKCANAAQCVIRCDRDGNINIEPLNITPTDYRIEAALAYSHPELTLSKQLREISVSYGDNLSYVLAVENSGETQTVDNSFVTTENQATEIATWVRDVLQSRKTLSGEFRADPRLDVFDVVSVESKYGVIFPVAITNLRYNYSGAFRATYTGKVIPSQGADNVCGCFVVGKSILG